MTLPGLPMSAAGQNFIWLKNQANGFVEKNYGMEDGKERSEFIKERLYEEKYNFIFGCANIIFNFNVYGSN